jgi:polyhydroxybutyrate depolymerase
VVATTSAACGVARGQAIHEDFTTPGGRTFHVWGPSGYNENKTYPVVIAFHGWYADGAAHESWFKMEDYVDNAAFVVYPDAVGGLWDLGGDSDLVFFDEMVKQLGQTYCINPSRVFGFGFSYGGKFMNHLGCKRAGYVKAISVGDGSDGGDGLSCGRLPVLFTNRTVDNNELVAWGRAASANWVTLNGCSAATTISDGPPSAAPVGGTADKTQNCVTHASCAAPGTVTFCEDSWFDPSWPTDWNHTVRDVYRAYTWRWFNALP